MNSWSNTVIKQIVGEGRNTPLDRKLHVDTSWVFLTPDGWYKYWRGPHEYQLQVFFATTRHTTVDDHLQRHTVHLDPGWLSVIRPTFQLPSSDRRQQSVPFGHEDGDGVVGVLSVTSYRNRSNFVSKQVTFILFNKTNIPVTVDPVGREECDGVVDVLSVNI